MKPKSQKCVGFLGMRAAIVLLVEIRETGGPIEIYSWVMDKEPQGVEVYPPK